MAHAGGGDSGARALRNPRVLFAAGVVLAAIVVAVVVLSLTSGGSGDDATPRVVRAELALEQFTPPGTAASELLVTLTAPELNTPETTGGERVVLLRCFDADGEVAIRRAADWPLLEEPGYDPHIHHPANRQLLDSIRACRLTGPGIDFQGQVTGRLPVSD